MHDFMNLGQHEVSQKTNKCFVLHAVFLMNAKSGKIKTVLKPQETLFNNIFFAVAEDALLLRRKYPC